jgi:hypothetical protein
VYPGQCFHLDVLPAIPNVDDEDAEDAIWLTDRELVRWQQSNPIGYAEWFARQMETDRRLLLEAAAAKRGIEIEDVPAETVRTPLQHSVQMLKRHRDIYFEDNPKLAPASIIVTTLAASAYEGGGDVFETLVDLTERMPELVEWKGGKYVVANPVLEDENFADRWAGRPRRSQAFFDWARAAHEAFTDLGRESGVDRLLERLAFNLGAEPVDRAGRRYAAGIREQQRTGRLLTRPSGLLVAAPAVGAVSTRTRVPANPQHTFHGRSRNTPR